MTDFSHFKAQRPNAQPARVVPFPGRTPERLVGYGFRCWLSGFQSGDITSWEEAWTAYEAATGRDHAKPLLLCLSNFVRAVKSTAERELEVYPERCRGFCRDECLAISIVAASQHDARRELCSCAAALIGAADIGDTITTAQAFASELRKADQVLSPSSICQANCPILQIGRQLQ